MYHLRKAPLKTEKMINVKRGFAHILVRILFLLLWGIELFTHFRQRSAVGFVCGILGGKAVVHCQFYERHFFLWFALGLYTYDSDGTKDIIGTQVVTYAPRVEDMYITWDIYELGS